MFVIRRPLYIFSTRMVLPLINLKNYKDLNEVKRLMAECMWAHV